MVVYEPGTEIAIGYHPVLRFFSAFPIAGFSGALLTDAAYVLTYDTMWLNFSDWLLAAAAAMGFLAAVAGFVELIRDPIMRRQGHYWLVALGSLITLALGVLNNLVHSRDGWTAVMPQGIALSAITVLVMLLTLAAGGRSTSVVVVEHAPGAVV